MCVCVFFSLEKKPFFGGLSLLQCTAPKMPSVLRHKSFNIVQVGNAFLGDSCNRKTLKTNLPNVTCFNAF